MSHSVLVSTIQSHFGTGHAGIDLVIGMVMTPVIMYLVHGLPKWSRLVIAMLTNKLWTNTKDSDTRCRYKINVLDTTVTDIANSRSDANGFSRVRFMGNNHSLIIHGVIQRLQAEGAVEQSSTQTVALMSRATSDSPRSRYMSMYMSVLPDSPIEHCDMLFEFRRVVRAKETNECIGKRQSDNASESTVPDAELNLIVSCNSPAKAMLFLEECRLAEVDRVYPPPSATKPERRIHVMLQRSDGIFRSTPYATAKSFRSVFFNDKERFLNLVDDFIHHRGTWRPELERAYKLVILMHSVPGCGKSSILKALSQHTGRDLVVVNPSYCNSNEELQQLFCSPNLNGTSNNVFLPLCQRILVMEDLDCNGCAKLLKRSKSENHSRSDKKDKLGSFNRQGATFSGFLNALDGVLEPTGLIVVMTTNRLSAFDSTLLRPGRVDCLLHLGGLNEEMTTQMVRFSHPNATDDEVALVNQAVKDSGKPLIPCYLQECLQWENTMAGVAKRVRSQHSPTNEVFKQALEREEKEVSEEGSEGVNTDE